MSTFDCTPCREDPSSGGMPLDTRRGWHCGWLEREEWTTYQLDAKLFDGAFTFPDGAVCDTCPGYLSQLPQMREATRATWALRKGVLPVYYPDAPAVLLDAVEIIDGAFAAYEARQMELAKART